MLTIPIGSRTIPVNSLGAQMDGLVNFLCRQAQALASPPQWADMPVDLPAWREFGAPRHVHVIPSLSVGGAERIVVDLASVFSECGTPVDVVVLRDAPSEHPIAFPGVNVIRLGGLPWPERLRIAAEAIRATGLPGYCHLTSTDELRVLWKHGVQTIPVVHNVRNGWREDPSAWEVDNVPFVVSCGEFVAADLRATGIAKPIVTIRHTVPGAKPMAPQRRLALRSAFGADAETLLVGMVGRIVSQKRYTRAVRILGELARRRKVRLVILGATRDEEGRVCRAAIEAEAQRQGVRHMLVMPGPVAEASSIVGAFDVFLNTSCYEGVSIATMEAVAAKVPVVTGDVGGQREAIGPNDHLLDEEASDEVWADAVERAADIKTFRNAPHGWVWFAAAHSWPWLAALGPGADLQSSDGSPLDCLFVTGNLDVGGAQRSLCNLVSELPGHGVNAAVAVVGPIGVPGFMNRAQSAGVEFLDLSNDAAGNHSLRARIGRVLSLVRARAPKVVCFWNMDAATKLGIAKVLAGGPVKIADVSPGPMLYAELQAEAEIGRILTLSPADFIGSLDLLVSKYADGLPAAHLPQPKAMAVIPNGVYVDSPMLPDDEEPQVPAGADPALAVITVGRLTAAKRPELLPPLARALERRVPGATLTVVGGVHGPQADAAWEGMLEAAGGDLPANLHFVGPDHRSTAFLPRFAAFYMVSESQGCPNASLEAMAAGLPVVANDDGGTGEQVIDGITGRLIPTQEDEAFVEALADALADLLLNPERARAMGRAGRDRVRTEFSMAKMAETYVSALLGC